MLDRALPIRSSWLFLFVLGGCSSVGQSELIAQFERALAAQPSATEALSRWCAERGLAETPRISARLVSGEDRPPPDGIRSLLGINGAEPVAYRHVKLSCGDTLLSQAHNWYVPSRLSAEMNQQLAQTDTPFGKVVSQLRFTRRPLSSIRGVGPGCPAGTILSNRAVLETANGAGLAAVIECYTQDNLR